MRKSLTILTFLVISMVAVESAAFAECTSKACIEVHVQDGKIVIEGKRNGSTSTPKPAVTRIYSAKHTSKPTIKPTIKQKTGSSIRATRKYVYRPRTSTPKPKVTTPSLADKVLQSLPTLQVAYQPEGAALPRVPIVFFTDLPTFFNKSYRILGVPVRIDVHPQSLWKFGDGSVLVTNKPGKPFPSKEITHSYSVPGRYIVEVETIWSGTYTIAGVTLPIDGVIRQVSAVDVKVVGASTRFVGK